MPPMADPNLGDQNWAETQAGFASSLMVPSKPPPADVARSIPDAVQSKRFDVYRNNVVSTAIDALAETFPACQQLVGEEFFRAVARAFLEVAPPSSPILAEIGTGFACFLEDFPPVMGQVPYLPDVARIEQARVKAYHAADADPLALEALVEIPGEAVGDVVLKRHPAAMLIRSHHPAGSLWAASTGMIAADQVDMSRGEDVLIVRPALDVDTLILPAGGGCFVSRLFAGQSIAQAAEAAAAGLQSEGDQAFDLSQHLTGAFGAGAFASLSMGTGEPEASDI